MNTLLLSIFLLSIDPSSRAEQIFGQPTWSVKERHVKPAAIAAARKTLAKAMVDGSSLQMGYVSNIATLLVERHGMGVDEAWKAAEEVVHIVFDE